MKTVFDSKTLEYMYRYLIKFVGTYRVKPELYGENSDFPRTNKGTIDPTFEDLYIPCRRRIIKHTYIGNDILCICFYDKVKTANNIFNLIKEKYPKIEIELDNSTSDGYIYFDAKDIKKIATIVNPKTSGKSIDPFSNKNLPKVKYKIPSKDLNELYEITKNLTKQETMHFFKETNSKFISGVRTLNGEKFNAKEEYKKSRMSSKEFIHSVGLWDKYLSYVKKHLKTWSKD